MSKRNRRKSGSRDRTELAIGIAWYRREEWPKLLSVAQDREKLEDTHEEWEQCAENGLRKVLAQGSRVEKVDVGVDELIERCHAQHVPLDGTARARFVSFKLRQQRTERGGK